MGRLPQTVFQVKEPHSISPLEFSTLFNKQAQTIVPLFENKTLDRLARPLEGIESPIKASPHQYRGEGFALSILSGAGVSMCLNTGEFIPHETGSPVWWIEPKIAQYPKSSVLARGGPVPIRSSECAGVRAAVFVGRSSLGSVAGVTAEFLLNSSTCLARVWMVPGFLGACMPPQTPYHFRGDMMKFERREMF